MIDVIERLQEESQRLARLSFDTADAGIAANVVDEAIDEINRLREFVSWIDTWISNPARAYSHDALEGLFGMTRDRMPALPSNQRE